MTPWKKRKIAKEEGAETANKEDAPVGPSNHLNTDLLMFYRGDTGTKQRYGYAPSHFGI